jgi:hypothetical protein
MSYTLLKSLAIVATVAVAVVFLSTFLQPFFIQFQMQSIRGNSSGYECPLQNGYPTSFQGYGFVLSNHRQFVIAPNSSAFLVVYYNVFYGNASDIYKDWSSYFSGIRNWVTVPSNEILSNSQAGLFASAVNESATGSQSLTVTYEISASSSAPDHTYTMQIWDWCGSGLLISVGESLYTGPLPSFL